MEIDDDSDISEENETSGSNSVGDTTSATPAPETTNK
jgi:hypothetical protein